jgi:fused signal recognition particle receptor
VDQILIIVLVVAVIAAISGLVIWRATGSAEAPATKKTHDLKGNLARTRSALGGSLSSVFDRDRLDDAAWEELEEALIAADVGVNTAAAAVEEARRQRPTTGEAARDALEDALVGMFAGEKRTLNIAGKPSVVLVVGVNGTGKTTSIAKLAKRLDAGGNTVILAAADTFRAAADEQLRAWAGRVGVEVVSGKAGSDPAAVAFEAYQRAATGGYDVVMVDTAGRLHSKSNLMDELAKVARVMEREAGEIGEVLLVIDGTTGQNAISQARSFTEAIGVTGIVLTKLDGTARGGIAVAVEKELGIPVKFIGVGEGVDDLVPFDPTEFVEALLEP